MRKETDLLLSRGLGRVKSGAGGAEAGRGGEGGGGADKEGGNSELHGKGIGESTTDLRSMVIRLLDGVRASAGICSREQRKTREGLMKVVRKVCCIRGERTSYYHLCLNI